MYAVVRIRGEIHLKPELKTTLRLLSLHKINHLVLVPENDSFKGMLKKIQSHVTYGEINSIVLSKLLAKKARLLGDKKIDESFLKEKKLKSIDELATALIDGKVSLADFGIKPVFRLRPPSKGYERKGIKKSFSVGGVAGYRAENINSLIKKMT